MRYLLALILAFATASQADDMELVTDNVSLQYGIKNWITFNQTNGSQLVDMVGSLVFTNYGTVRPILTNGNIGNCLFFGGGSNAYCSAGNGYSYSNNTTISVWFKTSDPTDSLQGIVGKTKAAGGFNRFAINRSTTQLLRFIYEYPTNSGTIIGNVATSISAYTNNVWHNVVGVIGTNDIKLYVDGAFIGSSNCAVSVTNYSSLCPLTIGCYNDASDFAANYFKGLIDDIKIIGRVWTPTEILLNYNNGFGTQQ